jgi:hypothetical protein
VAARPTSDIRSNWGSKVKDLFNLKADKGEIEIHKQSGKGKAKETRAQEGTNLRFCMLQAFYTTHNFLLMFNT